jgi:hypothetical protein
VTQLTDHFSLDELTHSSTAVRLGIDNTPDLETVARLTVCAMGLERVRALLGQAMSIDSGYRCPALNKAVGGVADSAHLYGYAADFICPGYGTPAEIARAIVASGIAFDQCIQEGTWVHISFDPRLRRQALTAKFGPGGATYASGV